MPYITDRLQYRMNLTIVSVYSHMSTRSPIVRGVTVFITAIALVLAIFCELAVFFTQRFDMYTFVDVIPTALVNTICLIYLPIAYVNRKRIEKIYETVLFHLGRDWSDEEMAAKRKFEELSHHIVNFISLALVLGAPAVILTAFTPLLLDVILPINETRRAVLPFPGEFFVDQEKYFYHILFFQYIITCIDLFVIGATESLTVAILCFLCGMFAIIGHRLKSILPNDSKIKNQGKTYNEEMLTNTIRLCMKDYQNMKELVQQYKLGLVALLNECGNLLVPSLFLVTAISFSITLVQVTNVEFVTPRSVLFAVAQITQFFIVSYVAQALINSSGKLLNTTYSAKWYDCPLNVQRLFILIMLAIRKPASVTVQSIFVLCLENFGTLTQTALSYFMVLRQFQ